MPTANKWYEESRVEIESFFKKHHNIITTEPTSFSPSKDYHLTVDKYNNDGVIYSRGRVWESSTHRMIADIKRNHDTFWHTWVQKKNKKEYLLCGEDIQGYNVIDIENNKTYVYIDPNALEGLGFHWLDALPSPDGEYLVVEGCYFSCPKITAVYDFSKPTRLPLPKVTILDNTFNNWYDVEGWVDNRTLKINHPYGLSSFDVLTRSY